MSDVGVWGSLNQQLQDYGDLVDRVLLSSPPTGVDPDTRNRLPVAQET